MITFEVIGVAGLAMAALAGFVLYRWRQRRRIHQVETWVRDFVAGRHGILAISLRINCSEDKHWPVLVSFDVPATGIRHDLQFACPTGRHSFALLSEKATPPSPFRPASN